MPHATPAGVAACGKRRLEGDADRIPDGRKAPMAHATAASEEHLQSTPRRRMESTVAAGASFESEPGEAEASIQRIVPLEWATFSPQTRPWKK